MTGIGAITQGWDVASIIFTLFILFFIGLVYHLTLESKREGLMRNARDLKSGRFHLFPHRRYIMPGQQQEQPWKHASLFWRSGFSRISCGAS